MGIEHITPISPVKYTGLDLVPIHAEPLRLPYASFVMNEDELDEFLRANPDEPLRLNTDDLLVTEYSSPRDLASGSVAGRFATLERLVGHPRSLEAMLVNGPRTGGARSPAPDR